MSSHFSDSISQWIDGAHAHLRLAAPDLADMVSDYAGEARFGAAVIAGDLATLPQGARVLEVGAGALLLSCALQGAGFQVTAVEPMGSGFSHMARLQRLVLDYARGLGRVADVLEIPAEQIEPQPVFDYAFSINVMEHVDDPPGVLRAIWAALRPGAGYRFVCPNYTFPMEPHFGIPTCGSKALTWRVFESRILGSRVVVDPAGTWRSLNWITVAQVRSICRTEFGVAPVFDREVTYRFLTRAMSDRSFQRRHGIVIRTLALLMAATGIVGLTRHLPAGVQPAMSCLLTRAA